MYFFFLKYWPNPEKFDPERFSAQNRENINWNAYMPFGVGPRNCLGMRMGLIQTKLGLAHFLRNHKYLPSKLSSNEMIYDPKSPLITKKGNILLNVEKC